MRLTCIICAVNLIGLGICGGVAALFGIDLLRLVTLENVTAMRCVLAVNGVSALFLIFALIAFKPFKGL